ncbi:MAG: aminotransferase class V-fold PLP-dependent enzyme [Ectothiorhodospiraceae bacterium]|nr:aminotransferase class V-fold PLP-dependent enzyme [Chromatiales bacterium]MCP5153496.1 aminotransferase class V-fold PLP-dependent enzyme [Ectothiorhodospiraceae bacterium]
MKDNYYFDNAATTWPKPECVYTSIDRVYRALGVNPGRAGHAMSVEAESHVARARRLLSEFFGHRGSPERVVFAANATDALNTALLGVLQPGDHVITTRLEHNSVLRPLHHLRERIGLEVSHIPADGKGYVDPDDIAAAFNRRTRLIVATHASNVLGSVQPIAAFGAVARERGALLLVDACQTAGVVPIDMDRMHIDLLAFTGHKGMFGPMGSGGLVVGEGVDVKASRFGGTGVNSAAPSQPTDYPHRLEAGTLNLVGILGLEAAQDWFADLGRTSGSQDADPDEAGASSADSHGVLTRRALRVVEARELGITGRMLDALEQIPGVTIHGPGIATPRVSTFSMNVAGLDAAQVGDMLDGDGNVCVRAGLHCAPMLHQDMGTLETGGTVRFSPGFFTDEEDVSAALDAILEIARFAQR